MPTYKYGAVNVAGEKVKGYLQGESKDDAEKKLEGRGYRESVVKAVKLPVWSRGITTRDLAIMCRQMSSVMSSDISVLDGLLLVAEQTRSQALQLSMSNVYDAMFQESTLSEAMAEQGVFPQYLVNMLTVGELSGEIDTVFMKLADYYDKDTRVKSKVRSAVAYPILLTLLMIWVIGLLVIRILPMFESMLLSMGGELPGATKSLMAISAFVATYGLVVLLGIAVLIVVGMWFAGTPKGRAIFDRFKLNLPISGLLHRRLLTSRFAHGMALLLESGVSVEESLLKIGTLLDNTFVQKKMEKVTEEIKQGKALAPALARMDIFPSMLLRMLTVGERTGRLGSMLSKSASFYDEDVDQALQRITTIIEPALILVLSVIVGGILLAVMLPLLNIMSMVG